MVLRLGFLPNIFLWMISRTSAARMGIRGSLISILSRWAKGFFIILICFCSLRRCLRVKVFSSYAAQFRWAFFEATNFPFVLSVIGTGTGSSFSSTINCNNVGYDLVATVNMKDVALYFGGGRLRNITTFIGGSGLTDDSLNHDVDSTANHAVFGVNIKLDKFFIAMEVDRYSESTYSGKLGTRF